MGIKDDPQMLGTKKVVQCYHCGKALLVSVRAFSVCCPYCSQRVGVENLSISNRYEVHRIETCGELTVEAEGFLRAHLHVNDLLVAGQLYGNVEAEGKVTLTATGRIKGDVRASRLEIDAGGLLEGYCDIQPERESTRQMCS
jgi:hypothetical protein